MDIGAHRRLAVGRTRIARFELEGKSEVFPHPDRLETQFFGKPGIGGEVFAAALKQKSPELHRRHRPFWRGCAPGAAARRQPEAPSTPARAYDPSPQSAIDAKVTLRRIPVNV